MDTVVTMMTTMMVAANTSRKSNADRRHFSLPVSFGHTRCGHNGLQGGVV